MLTAVGNEPLAVAAGQIGDAVQVQGGGPPPPPVIPHDRADPVEPDRARLVTVAHRVGRAQVQDVLHVLLVQFNDLKLAEQQIGQVHGQRHSPEPARELNRVTHVQPVDQDFALSTDVYHEVGRRVAGLGLPTLVLQEGGYFVPKLGENARTWLRGLLGCPLDLRATPHSP